MVLRFLLSTAEVKDLHSQFGVVATTFINAVQLGIRALIASLFHNNQSHVIWDRSIATLQLEAERTALFLDTLGVVVMRVDNFF